MKKGRGISANNRKRGIEWKKRFEQEAMLVGFCLLVAYHLSNMQVYLRDGSAQTILRAATLR